MAYTKVSLSLSEKDVAFLDGEALEGRFPTRSAAVQEAVRLLRESRLADAYAEAYGEWNDDADVTAWDATAADGIA
ncbi:ribbon-helix-helix domain-containing protein [Microbacterium invictum]|uniref:Arc/MetJ-type ribon-helix-helix transcriptional regulator n=1 Tax=Microbacterium invictum TaxID=515415 RepID=A0AA40VNI7_9MICO|nr:MULTISPECIES: ribbon-helix-helix domain-containing protein [Microbacterium]MBB4140927.1 Arc/MetJ-type ribon-helix-helix transcriptional regulator [Microbacterium invictum]